MKTATIQLETLTCPSCTQKIMAAVNGFDAVDKDSVNVMFNSSRVRFDFDADKTDLAEIEAAITRVGYDVLRSRVK